MAWSPRQIHHRNWPLLNSCPSSGGRPLSALRSRRSERLGSWQPGNAVVEARWSECAQRKADAHFAARSLRKKTLRFTPSIALRQEGCLRTVRRVEAATRHLSPCSYRCTHLVCTSMSSCARRPQNSMLPPTCPLLIWCSPVPSVRRPSPPCRLALVCTAC